MKPAPNSNEFFPTIFGHRSSIYKGIIDRLLLGSATQEEILKSCGRSKTGDFSEYLLDLEMAGFVARDYTWHLKDGSVSKLSQYRLKDNYVRFYLKYLCQIKQKLKKGFIEKFYCQLVSLSACPACQLVSLSGWESIMGLQFENLRC